MLGQVDKIAGTESRENLADPSSSPGLCLSVSVPVSRFSLLRGKLTSDAQFADEGW
jgi:hypothetical protein